MACAFDDATFDQVVPQSQRETTGAYFIPEVARLHEQLWEQLRIMLLPVQAADETLTDSNGTTQAYLRRLETLARRTPQLEEDLISGHDIDEMTSAQPAAGDNVHMLVMNLHKELNRLQRLIAAESIDGAGVYSVTDQDRPLIAAFMRGVNRTRKLKFDHPGLDTTATRCKTSWSFRMISVRPMRTSW